MQTRLGPSYDPALDADRLRTVDDLVLQVLADGRWHRRSELMEVTRGAAVNSSVARLRKAGHDVRSRRALMNVQVWEYRLVAAGAL